ncbi:hypothetical protein MVES_002791 [Malassezia vespertilionis]|uniref:RRM domain-containing protein n=1 Tax=Malassezia vespertilionis TaxID=2020962 RepID=A0A2N1J9R9_9BASI|nr:hypothetical protein MVES_002791 [Malassezia vespertilionis]
MAGPPAYLDTSEAAVHLDQQSRAFVWEEENEEWEWNGRAPDKGETYTTQGRWIKAIGADEISKQQAAYSIQGVDESIPVAPVLKRQQGGMKRKQEAQPASGPTKKTRPNTAVYVSDLPLDADREEIAQVFARYGVLLEDDQGEPRVKLYHDSQTGAFKGEALVVYFKPESVELAIQLLDDSYLRAAKGVTSGPQMHVERAEFRAEPSAEGEAAQAKPRTLTETEKKSIQRRMSRMHNKINDWDSGSEEERAGPSAQARTVILKKMFTLAELDQDPTMLLDLKQDVREECELLGTVTNVVLWDKEPEGVMTGAILRGGASPLFLPMAAPSSGAL